MITPCSGLWCNVVVVTTLYRMKIRLLFFSESIGALKKWRV